MSPFVNPPTSGDGDLAGGALALLVQAANKIAAAASAPKALGMRSVGPILNGLGPKRWMLSTSVTRTGATAFRLLMRGLVVALSLVLVACGSIGLGSNPSPSPSENPFYFDVTATEKDHAV